jgi:hypothetical protein
MKLTVESIEHGSALREREQYASDAAWRLRILGIITDDQQKAIDYEVNKYNEWHTEACRYVLDMLPLRVVEILKAQPNYMKAMWLFPSPVLLNSKESAGTITVNLRNHTLGVSLAVEYRPKNDTIYVDAWRNSFKEQSQIKFEHEKADTDEQIFCAKELISTYVSIKDLKKQIAEFKLPV